MAAPSPASRLLTEAARAALHPLGVRQQGRSRVWIDDHGWWLGVVEFQPGTRQGAYLNVGVHFLWWPGDHPRFDIGGRVLQGLGRTHTAYRNPEQFAAVAAGLAERAAARITYLRGAYADAAEAAATLPKAHSDSDELWRSHHAGLACALAGDADAARGHFEPIRAAEPSVPWVGELRERTLLVTELLDDRAALRAWAAEEIGLNRARLRLEPATPAAADPEQRPAAV